MAVADVCSAMPTRRGCRDLGLQLAAVFERQLLDPAVGCEAPLTQKTLGHRLTPVRGPVRWAQAMEQLLERHIVQHAPSDRSDAPHDVVAAGVRGQHHRHRVHSLLLAAEVPFERGAVPRVRPPCGARPSHRGMPIVEAARTRHDGVDQCLFSVGFEIAG